MTTKKPTRFEQIIARLKTDAGDLGMNRTELRFAQHLELLKAGGVIQWYGFEAVSLKISRRTRYTPDFAVLYTTGEFFLYEVKATWRDKVTKKPKYGWKEASKVRFETASTLYPFFRFRAVRPGLRPLGEVEWVEYDPAN